MNGSLHIENYQCGFICKFDSFGFDICIFDFLCLETWMVGEIQKSEGYSGEPSNIFSGRSVYDH